MNAVSVRCLRHVYPDRTEVSLCGLDFVVEKGRRVAVLGPNGSGKTTLLMHLTGLLRPVDGEVRVLGVDPSRGFPSIRDRVGVVLQNAGEQIIGPTVWDDVAFGPRSKGIRGEALDMIVDRALAEVGIAPLKKKVPHYLSGGEKKKVALAGAMVLNPELLILDEPFEGLDSRSRLEIAGVVNGFNQRSGTTVIVTTHDVNMVPLIADQVYVISRKGIIFRGSPREVLIHPETLVEANLEPPVLTELSRELRQAGIDIGCPVTVSEAKDAVLSALSRNRQDGARLGPSG